MKLRRVHLLLFLLMLALCAIPFRRQVRNAYFGSLQRFKGRRTIAERLIQFEAPVRSRLEGHLRNAGLEFPPRRLTFIGLKSERIVEAWGQMSNEPPRRFQSYPILAASGTLGPKLAEGDRQIPEGLYRIESLNPNSSYHLALRVGYPNTFDRQKGALDGRKDLGSDIMIHGSSVSIGCLALGDEAAEDLFVLAARTGVTNVAVILSPVDFRQRDLPPGLDKLPGWINELYSDIRKAMTAYKE